MPDSVSSPPQTNNLKALNVTDSNQKKQEAQLPQRTRYVNDTG